MIAANVVSYSAQVAMLVLACAALPRVLGVRSPALQYLFWRSLLALGLLLPAIEPWRSERMVLAPAPAAFASSPLAGAATAGGLPPGVPLAALAPAIAGVVLLLGMAARLAWLSVGIIRLQRLRT